MENSGQYQSLFKSFRRAHPPKEAAESQPSIPKVTVGRPVTAQKTVDQLLAGRKEVRPVRHDESEDGEESSRNRKSIDQILAGAKVKRPKTPGMGMASEGVESIQGPMTARKQVADILSNSSSTILRPVKSSFGQAQLPFTIASSSSLATVNLEQTSKSEVSIRKEARSDLAIRQTQSQRVLFDFASPAKLKRQKSAHENLLPLRQKFVEQFLEISPSQTVLTFSSSGHGNWQKNKAFDALLSSIDDDTQTEDFDSRESEESQTDLCDKENSWCQLPTKFSDRSETDLPWLRAEGSGSGSDPLKTTIQEVEETKHEIPRVIDATSLLSLDSPLLKELKTENLDRFVRNTSKLLLALVSVNTAESAISVNEERSDKLQQKSGDAKKKKKPKITEFNRGLDHLNKLSMHTLDCDWNYVACANSPSNPDPNSQKNVSEVKNIITVWAIKEPVVPKHFLRVWGRVTMIKLGFGSDIIVSGSHNGTLNVWDMHEDEKKHTEFEGVYVRTASVHTGCINGENHHSEIIGLQVLPETKSSAQIISMEKDHKIICWSCIQSPVVDRADFSVNSVPWATICVRVRQVLNLPELFRTSALASTSLSVWEGYHKYFVFGTNNGFVGKGRIVASSFDTHCEKFYADKRDSLIPIHQIDVNPKVNLIIAACGDCSIRIFEMTKQKAIISVACAEFPRKVLWSKQRLSVFYVAFQNKVLIWDMIASDLTPMQKCQSPKLVDFHLVVHDDREALIFLSMGGTKLFRVAPPCNLTPLDESQEKLMRHYIMVNL